MATEGDIFVEVTGNPLSLDTLSQQVEDPGAGAVATFMGVTRNTFDGKEVLKLEYEAYKPMAKKKLMVGVAADGSCLLSYCGCE